MSCNLVPIKNQIAWPKRSKTHIRSAIYNTYLANRRADQNNDTSHWKRKTRISQQIIEGASRVPCNNQLVWNHHFHELECERKRTLGSTHDFNLKTRKAHYCPHMMSSTISCKNRNNTESELIRKLQLFAISIHQMDPKQPNSQIGLLDVEKTGKRKHPW